MRDPKLTKLPLRPGAARVDVYNEGLFVFAYDAANEALLKDAAALELLLSAPSDAAAEARGAELAASGLIVIWELVQDDPRVVDVAVGPALSAKERKAATWHPPQTSLLSLPSGELRIHTYNTCPIAADPGTDPPGNVTVPPGDYVFNLHRVDWERMDEPLSAREDLPTEFVTLTPRAGKPPKKWAAVLTLDDLFGRDMRWVRTGKAEPGRFAGLLKSGPVGDLVTNLGPREADAMGLRFADRLRLETDGWSSEAIYLGRAGTNYTGYVFGKEEYASRFTSATPLALQFEPLDMRGTTVLGLSPWGREAPALPTVPEEGVALSVTRIAPPVFPPLDRALVGGAVVEKGGTIRTTVAFGTGAAVLVNVTWKELKKAKIGFSDSLLARFTAVDGTESERLIHLDTPAAKKSVAAAREALADRLAVSAEARAGLAAMKKKFQIWGLFENVVTQHEAMEAIKCDPTPPEIAAQFPLIAREYQHPDVPGQSVLVLLPLLRDKTHLEAAPGSPVWLRKA